MTFTYKKGTCFVYGASPKRHCGMQLVSVWSKHEFTLRGELLARHHLSMICSGRQLNTRWWFQIFFIFTPIWGNDPIWLIFFRWVETTNYIDNQSRSSRWCFRKKNISEDWKPSSRLDLHTRTIKITQAITMRRWNFQKKILLFQPWVDVDRRILGVRWCRRKWRVDVWIGGVWNPTTLVIVNYSTYRGLQRVNWTWIITLKGFFCDVYPFLRNQDCTNFRGNPCPTN